MMEKLGDVIFYDTDNPWDQADVYPCAYGACGKNDKQDETSFLGISLNEEKKAWVIQSIVIFSVLVILFFVIKEIKEMKSK